MGKPKNPEKSKNPNEKKAIDNIFSALKSKPKVISKEKRDLPLKRVKKSDFQKDKKPSHIQGPAEEPGRKRTDEGFKIYSFEELQLGKGGGTKQCPFDCDCCF